MFPLGHIIHKCYISFRSYADNTALYLPLQPCNYNKLTGLNNCLQDINSWMAQNFLQLGEDNSKIMLTQSMALISGGFDSMDFFLL